MWFLTCLYVRTFWGGRSGQRDSEGRRERWEVGWVARTGVRKGQERGRHWLRLGRGWGRGNGGRKERIGGILRQWEKSWQWWVNCMCALDSKAVQVLGGCSRAAGVAFVPFHLGKGCAGATWLLAPVAQLAWSLPFSALLWRPCGGPSTSFCAFFFSSVVIAGEEK